ncbi:protein phosphatase 1 regulatory subunit 15B [Larimichthys crocea]|uniref:protein phosphatase 1 regulatory subunit 15B n=1 Tax=Larimichthys crocea TaxID=215358 RepID=UPI0009011254|nr:protein phosphatase 1 regulatory subunit 15B [Larimichthys crocea]
MFRNISGDGSSSPTGHGVASPGLNGQESSWIGLLSVVSRPAVSFLQKYLPGRSPVLPDRAGWMSGDLTSLVDEDSDFLSPLDLPPQHRAPHLTYLRCQHGLLQPEGGGALPWLTADSLREIGIDSGEEMNLCPQTQVGHLSSARTLLSQVWLNSEVRPRVGQDCATTRPWWGSLWGSKESSWAEDRTLTGRLCPQQPAPETKGPDTTESVTRWRLGERAGPPDHKDANNGGQNTEGSEPDHRLSIRNHLRHPGPLTPDQDNGYSSLEEEQLHLCRLYLLKPRTGPEPETGPTDTSDAVLTEMEEESPEESMSGEAEEEEEEQEAASEEVTKVSTPQCQNKSIAFIMGCSLSDDSTDDDGFDSDSSSDEDESDSDSVDASEDEVEDEVEDERLWKTWCHSTDPYNPLNFTAQLHSSTAPRTIPPTTPPSSTQSTPTSSPDLTLLPLSSPPLSSSSPPSSLDVWDDSTSASEADEAESLHLWRSFSCSSDPYSPLNFQAPLRTRDPGEAGTRARTKTRKTSQTGPCHTTASPPKYRKEEAEERLDSGFSEPCASSNTSTSSSTARRCSTTKKVRFCDDVEEFFASGGEEDEDRHGPWEELARDRCRFLRRCQEVEQSIAFCLQPQHRRKVYCRLAAIYTHA